MPIVSRTLILYRPALYKSFTYLLSEEARNVLLFHQVLRVARYRVFRSSLKLSHWKKWCSYQATLVFYSYTLQWGMLKVQVGFDPRKCLKTRQYAKLPILQFSRKNPQTPSGRVAAREGRDVNLGPIKIWILRRWWDFSTVNHTEYLRTGSAHSWCRRKWRNSCFWIHIMAPNCSRLSCKA